MHNNKYIIDIIKDIKHVKDIIFLYVILFICNIYIKTLNITQTIPPIIE